MTTLFLNPDKIKVKVPLGMNLRQVAMMTDASMEFDCKAGDCGTCIAKIDKGMEFLSKINQKERSVIETLDQASDNLRLMCQCMIDSQEGEIVISYY